MLYTGQVIRFFISSTFHDMQQERNALQTKVFPRLREFCRERGARFQPVDLRWGVSQEASQDHRTLAICLEEIRRCREVSPDFNFLVLLGERHGSDLLPEQIDKYEFETLLDNIDASEREALKPLYLLDCNASPLVYVLQPRDKKQYPNYEAWEPVQRELHTVLATACKRAQLDATAQLKYLASATELEIEEGVFKHPAEKEQQPLCFFRTIDGVPRDASLFVEQDSEKYTRLVNIKRRLKERVPDAYAYTARWAGKGCSEEHLEAFCEAVYSRLEARIEVTLARPQQVQAVDREKEAFRQFARDRTRNFVKPDAALATIEAYLKSATPYPLVVTGPSGSGKSTLLAYMANMTHINAAVESVYIGVTPDSSNTRTLLTNLWYRIRDAYGGLQSTVDGEPVTIPTDERALVEKFSNLLRLARADKPLLLFIDALDQLREGSQRNWIPRRLPSHVRMVVSTLPGVELDVLSHDIPASHLLTLEKMTREQGEALLALWLENEAKRTLQPEQRTAVLDAFVTNGLPLYLRLAFEEAHRWPSYKKEGIHLEQDIPGILRDLFKRLAQDSYHGPALVSHSLGYLHAAKNGLSEDEMLDLLKADKEVLADIKRISPDSPAIEPEAPIVDEEARNDSEHASSDSPQNKPELPFPVVLWSRLSFDLNPYLTERSADGTNLIGFYHQQVGEEVQNMYQQGDEKLARHRALTAYFQKQPLVNGTVQNLRKMSELPFQQTEGEQWDDLYETLTDFRFLEEKAKTGKTLHEGPNQGTLTYYTGVYDLQEDFDWALAKMPGE